MAPFKHQIVGTGKTLEEAMKDLEAGEKTLNSALGKGSSIVSGEKEFRVELYGKKQYVGEGATYKEAMSDAEKKARHDATETQTTVVIITQSYQLTAEQKEKAKAVRKPTPTSPLHDAPTLTSML